MVRDLVRLALGAIARASPALGPLDARHRDRHRGRDPADVDRRGHAPLHPGAVHAVRDEHHDRDPSRQVEDVSACPACSAAPAHSSRSTTPRRSRASPGVETHGADRRWARARVEAGGRARSVAVNGVTPDMPTRLEVPRAAGRRSGRRATRAAARRWPCSGRSSRASSSATTSPLGELVRIGGSALPRDRRDGAEGPDAGLRPRRHRVRAGGERARGSSTWTSCARSTSPTRSTNVTAARRAPR